MDKTHMNALLLARAEESLAAIEHCLEKARLDPITAGRLRQAADYERSRIRLLRDT